MPKYIILLSFNRSWYMLHHNTYELHVHVSQHIKSDTKLIMIKADKHVGMYDFVQMQNACAES